MGPLIDSLSGRLQGGESKAEAFSRRGKREERKEVLSSRLGSWRQEISVLLSFLGGGSGSWTHLPEVGPSCCRQPWDC